MTVWIIDVSVFQYLKFLAYLYPYSHAALLLTNQDVQMLQVLLGAASIVIIIAGLKISSGIFAPFFFALTLTFLFAPILQWLKKKKLPSWLAILIMILILLTFFGILIAILYSSSLQLIDKLPMYEQQLEKQIVSLQKSLQSLATQWNIPAQTGIPKDWLDGSMIIRTAFSLLSNLIASSAYIIFFLFMLILMLIASDTVIEKFKKRFDQTSHFASQLSVWSTTIQQQYKLQTLSNLLVGTALTLIFFLLKIDFALLWGLLAFLLAYIPNLGLVIASIPPVILAFIQYGPETALLIAGAIFLLNVLMDNIITPRIMGKGLDLPMIVVFLSILFWTYVFGLLGVFLALPITIAIRSLLHTGKKTRFFADLLSN